MMLFCDILSYGKITPLVTRAVSGLCMLKAANTPCLNPNTAGNLK